MFDLGGSTEIVDTESAGQKALQGSAGGPSNAGQSIGFGNFTFPGTSDQDPSGILGFLLPFLANITDPNANPFINGIGGPNANVQGATGALQGILDAGPQGLLNAAQPVFEQNFQFGLGQLASAAPTTRGSAFGNQAIDFATRQDTAFNLFAEQALQNFQGNQISAANQLGNIGLQQQANTLNPTIALLLGALGQAFPDAAIQQNPGLFDFLGLGVKAATGIFGGGGGD